ncbi:hypothetical protein CEP54_014216 [Fusarium duplospermum]|uniref:MARVEL domain-containing protein n=1 Tax=Fusarium duplospermum TaxID=1325734 RepID=A0A428NXQ2_9HYPO|nr:hypothetical protein CEP54_014216 [Fusarium duplospermum]
MPGKLRRNDSPYPLLPLIIVRVFQTASFLIVIPTVSYLVFHLHNRHVFLHLLSAASYFTLLQLAAVPILSRFYPLHLAMRLIIDTVGCSLWIAGFCFMTAYDLKHNILARCNRHLVCTLYKVMFSSATVGLVAAIFVVLLDVYVMRRVQSGYKNIANQADGEQELLQGYRPNGSWSYP